MEKRLSAANDLRESEKYSESIEAYTKCLIDLVDTRDYVGLVHCLGGQSLIYKNLITKNDSPIYHYFTVAYAKEALEVGEQNKDSLDGRTLSIAYSGYGDALIINDEHAEALTYFEKAIAVTTADIPEKARLEAHIGKLMYHLGEKEKGLAKLNHALDDIRTGDLDTHAIRVWETGVLNDLAKIYVLENQKDKGLSLAEQSLQIARDHHLSVRIREAEGLVKIITSDRGVLSI